MTDSGLSADVHVDVGSLSLRVELSVASGETVAVLGPNGAGKTTLLRALAGLQPMVAGDVSLDGVVLDGDPATRSVGFVFQDYVLFPHLSVLENVAFGLRARGGTRHACRQEAAQWLARIGLSGRGSDRPAALSGGEAQRVALARALATSPRLLLLDEPLSALDATTRAAMRRDLAATLAAHDGVKLVVTHDPLEAMALADRLVILEAGLVVQDGTAAEITARPRSAYVADLVGVNLLSGVAVGDGLVAVAGASGLRLQAAEGSVEGDVFAVVHPRAVALHRAIPEGSARNTWRGEVTSVEAEGGRARARLVLDGGVVLVAEITPAAVSDLGLTDGGSVWASVKATEVNVYPR
ncbi:MAG TPA: ABC transporter ATP-binding protein [Acidimicrobiales bacterium]|nr:ABC transporter ATP-binding protein [Acidimicrobiales bacterium]